MAATDPSVLVVGVVPSLTWAVAHCLRRAGRTPLVLARQACWPMLWSGDCRRHLRWQGVRGNGAPLDTAALTQVRQVCDSAGIERVIGADHDTVLLLAQGAAAAQLPVCALPQPSTMLTFHDQWNLTRLLRAAGLPAPDSMRADDAAQLLAHPLVYPIITRPLDHRAGAGCQVHRSPAALQRTLARGRLAPPFPLIAQSWIPGWKVGASFLASKGRLAACSVYRHRRRGERTFYPSARVREYVERFAAACDYSGAGHLELRYDPARDSYVILALNPHGWASLLYTERAGLNYPDLLLSLDGAPTQVATPRAGRVRLPWHERLAACAGGATA
ncbi:putative ATP-grasp superfamily ATP-dependent carboligase [Duganella sp. 1224]|uniref:hypothetical protein n=1 Tax=Duganella sp. 1224 TaxID=2587052 RepID=UPI0015CDA288|nr:hypothetical protein [Duganella sp. 1224]NYE59495.1 putative ATP-grasp superfamily ATP-dependent carboligase [Duganella sp. 1224]